MERLLSRSLHPLSPDLPETAGKPGKRAHLSCLSGSRQVSLQCKQLRQTAQIDRQHRQRKHISHFRQAAQLDLPDGAAVLLAVTEQGLDHLADDLADSVTGLSGGARQCSFRAWRACRSWCRIRRCSAPHAA